MGLEELAYHEAMSPPVSHEITSQDFYDVELNWMEIQIPDSARTPVESKDWLLAPKM